MHQIRFRLVLFNQDNDKRRQAVNSQWMMSQRKHLQTQFEYKWRQKGIEWVNKKARRLLERSISPVKIQLQPFCKGSYISIQLRNSMTLNPFLWWWMRLKNELQNYGVDLHKINWTAFYCMLIEFLPSPAWRLERGSHREPFFNRLRNRLTRQNAFE